MAGTESAQALGALLAACGQGDRRAFAQLYQSAAPTLFGLALRMLRQRDRAEDVLQEAFIRIWQHAADYRPQTAAPMTWMSSIVRYRALDVLRRQARTLDQSVETEAMESASDDAGPMEAAEQQDAAALLQACLDALSASHRQCVVLAYQYGYSHDELSRRLDAPLGSVKSWIRRGLSALRKCLGQ